MPQENQVVLPSYRFWYLSEYIRILGMESSNSRGKDYVKGTPPRLTSRTKMRPSMRNT